MSPILAAYRTAGSAAVALGLPQLLLRGRPEELRERLGHGPDVAPGALWIHAASLGEMVAAAGLLRALRAASPVRVAVTAMTRTGRERARSLAPEIGPAFAPLDAAVPVRRFVERVRPCGLVLLETELWPVLLEELLARGIPWAVASARLTARSVSRLKLVRGDARRLLGGAAAVAARTQDDAARFVTLGVRADRVRVTGDLKEDREPAPWTDPATEPPRWIAACTRPGEEADVLAALPELEARIPSGELWIAPRHPERFEEVAGILDGAGRPWRRWRERGPDDAATTGWSVVLVDEMGVLDEAYRAARFAFVGGSLRPFGGHSPLEAAAAGRAVLVGPHTANCADAVERLETAGALIRVADAGSLAESAARLLGSREESTRRGRAARDAVVAASGSGAATVAFLRERGAIP